MTSSRIFYYDVLNVVSCLSVIALHCNGYVHQFDTALLLQLCRETSA